MTATARTTNTNHVHVADRSARDLLCSIAKTVPGSPGCHLRRGRISGIGSQSPSQCVRDPMRPCSADSRAALGCYGACKHNGVCEGRREIIQHIAIRHHAPKSRLPFPSSKFQAASCSKQVLCPITSSRQRTHSSELSTFENDLLMIGL